MPFRHRFLPNLHLNHIADAIHKPTKSIGQWVLAFLMRFFRPQYTLHHSNRKSVDKPVKKTRKQCA